MNNTLFAIALLVITLGPIVIMIAVDAIATRRENHSSTSPSKTVR